MHVREEGRLDFDASVTKRGDAFLISGGRAPDYTRPKVDEIRRVIDHDGGRRTGAVRIGAWRAGAEHDHARRSMRARRFVKLVCSRHSEALLRIVTFRQSG